MMENNICFFFFIILYLLLVTINKDDCFKGSIVAKKNIFVKVLVMISLERN